MCICFIPRLAARARNVVFGKSYLKGNLCESLWHDSNPHPPTQRPGNPKSKRLGGRRTHRPAGARGTKATQTPPKTAQNQAHKRFPGKSHDTFRPWPSKWLPRQRVAQATNCYPGKNNASHLEKTGSENSYWSSLGIPEGALLNTAFGNLNQVMLSHRLRSSCALLTGQILDAVDYFSPQAVILALDCQNELLTEALLECGITCFLSDWVFGDHIRDCLMRWQVWHVCLLRFSSYRHCSFLRVLVELCQDQPATIVGELRLAHCLDCCCRLAVAATEVALAVASGLACRGCLQRFLLLCGDLVHELLDLAGQSDIWMSCTIAVFGQLSNSAGQL